MYLETFNYEERVTLLTVLIDNIHDTNEFRMFLNKRIENKAVFNKEKMDYYMQIRELESKQAEMNRTMQENNEAEKQEQIAKELVELRASISTASRTETKEIRDKIFRLERQKAAYEKQISQYEEQIKKKQVII